MKANRLVVVGNPEAVHVGAHLQEAAQELGLAIRFCDARHAFEAPGWLARVNWHLRGRRPRRLRSFSADVVELCREFEPEWLLATGVSPIREQALASLGQMGVARINYLTDDPWNPAHRAAWFLRALPQYDRVLSPRQSNLAALHAHGCRGVSYVPFAYAASQHFASGEAGDADFGADIVFAGGADRDRVSVVTALIGAGFRLALYGGYWSRYRETLRFDRGHADPGTLREATRAAKIALCLVRRANRDGHVMRSFEIPAIGACMLTEDTEEHRELFGPDGEAVVYFGSIAEMIEKARWLLERPAERERLAAAAHARIVGGRNTYQDRLATMLGLKTKEHEDRYSCPRPLSCV